MILNTPNTLEEITKSLQSLSTTPTSKFTQLNNKIDSLSKKLQENNSFLHLVETEHTSQLTDLLKWIQKVNNRVSKTKTDQKVKDYLGSEEIKLTLNDYLSVIESVLKKLDSMKTTSASSNLVEGDFMSSLTHPEAKQFWMKTFGDSTPSVEFPTFLEKYSSACKTRIRENDREAHVLRGEVSLNQKGAMNPVLFQKLIDKFGFPFDEDQLANEKINFNKSGNSMESKNFKRGYLGSVTNKLLTSKNNYLSLGLILGKESESFVREYINSKNSLINSSVGTHSQTVLHVTCSRKDKINRLPILLEYGASIYSKDSYGNTPGDYCIFNNNLEAFKCLENYFKLPEDNQLINHYLAYSISQGSKVFLNYLLSSNRYGINCNSKIVHPITGSELPIFLYAIEWNRLEMTKLLLEMGCSIETQDDEDRNGLHYAAKVGDVDMITFLKENGCPYIADIDEITPIALAGKTPFLGLTKDILKTDLTKDDQRNIKNAAVETGLYDNLNDLDLEVLEEPEEVTQKSLLLKSIQMDDSILATHLIELNVNVNQGDKDKNKPVHLVAEKENPFLFHMIMERGAKVNVFNQKRESPLYYLCKSKTTQSLEMMKEVLSSNEFGKLEDEEIKTPDGSSLLHISIQNGSDSKFNLLMNKGANLNVLDLDNNTCLMTSLIFQKPEICNQIISSGKISKENLNTQNKQGKTALHLALPDINDSVSERLIDLGADVSIQDSQKTTPLLLCCVMKKSSILEKMAESGVNFNFARNMTDDKKWSPVYATAYYGELRMLNALIKAGCDVNTEIVGGWVALHAACHNGHLEVVRSLIENGADLNKRDEQGSTPLFQACYGDSNKCLEIVNILLSKGAHPDYIQDGDPSPLQRCIWNQNTKCTMALLNNKTPPKVSYKRYFQGSYSSASLAFCTFFKETEEWKAILEKFGELDPQGVIYEERDGCTELIHDATFSRYPRPYIVKWALEKGSNCQMSYFEIVKGIVESNIYCILNDGEEITLSALLTLPQYKFDNLTEILRLVANHLGLGEVILTGKKEIDDPRKGFYTEGVEPKKPPKPAPIYKN